MPQVIINYLVIILTALVNMFIGYLWYSRFMFGNRWLILIGRTELQLKKMGNFIYLYSFLASLVMSYVLAVIISFSEVNSIIGGAFVGFILWLGFIATTSLNSFLFAGRSSRLYLIDNGYYLLSLMIMGGLLAIFY